MRNRARPRPAMLAGPRVPPAMGPRVPPSAAARPINAPPGDQLFGLSGVMLLRPLAFYNIDFLKIIFSLQCRPCRGILGSSLYAQLKKKMSGKAGTQ